MAWLSRLFGRDEKRAITSLPFNNGGYLPSDLGTTKAMSLVPMWSCVRLLADNVSSLPLQAYRRMDDGSRVPMNNLPSLISKPSAVGNMQRWLHQAVMSLTLRGNAYGLITARDGFGYPTSVEWLNPDELYVDSTRPTLPIYRWRGEAIPISDVIHISWMSLPGSVVGLSPVTAFAHTLGLGLAATSYGQSWFDNGGTPPGTFQNTQQTVNDVEADTIRDRLSRAMRSRKPLVFGSDWKFEALQVNPEESQFIQTMKLNATQIANIFGVPPEMAGGESGHSMTYHNVEQQQISFVQHTLRPWLVLLENALSDLLPDRQYVKFNTDALVRADIKTRYEAHHIALLDGWKSKDEIRSLEDLQPLPDGEGASYGQPQPSPASHFPPILNGNGVPALVNGSHK